MKVQFAFLFPARGEMIASDESAIWAAGERRLSLGGGFADLAPNREADIVMEDNPSLRWGVRKSAAAAEPARRGASYRAGDGRRESVLGEMGH